MKIKFLATLLLTTPILANADTGFSLVNDHNSNSSTHQWVYASANNHAQLYIKQNRFTGKYYVTRLIISNKRQDCKVIFTPKTKRAGKLNTGISINFATYSYASTIANKSVSGTVGAAYSIYPTDASWSGATYHGCVVPSGNSVVLTLQSSPKTTKA